MPQVISVLSNYLLTVLVINQKRLSFRAFASVLFLFPISLNAQTSACTKASTMVQLLNEFHYSPVELNDSFSKRTFHYLIDHLDPNSVAFLKSDVESTIHYEFMIDDEIKNNSCAFYNVLFDLYLLKMEKVKSHLNSLRPANFDFTKKEVMTYHQRKVGPKHPDSEDAWKSRWRRLIKAQTLKTFLTDQRLEAKTVAQLEREFESIQEELVSKIIGKHIRKIENRKSLNGGLHEFITSAYLNSIAAQYDPHTGYLSPEEHRGLNESLSRKMLSFGFEVVSNEEGNLSIGPVIPGGSAWEVGNILEGDVIISIGGGETKSLDLSLFDSEDIIPFIQEQNIDSILLKTENQLGEVVSNVLKKSTVQNTDNALKGFSLKGDLKIGYINLPSFYRGDFSSNDITTISRGCAEDVAKEIIRLKKLNIQGLIIDLRFNGGGDLHEAIELIGTFIDFGTGTVLASRNHDPEFWKDNKRGSTWSGPLLVMINGASASASELFSAAMQDYNRGIIVGGSSFGKATAQRTLPLHPNPAITLMQSGQDFSDGYLSITTDQFYRVTGRTHQNRGVEPDVLLPDPFEALGIVERELYNPLKADSLHKKIYFNPLEKLPIQRLRELSEGRQELDSAFIRSERELVKLAALRDQELTVPLDLKGNIEFEKQQFNQFKAITDLGSTDTTLFNIESHRFGNQLNELDKASNALKNQIVERIRNDKHLEEAWKILADYIKLLQNE